MNYSCFTVQQAQSLVWLRLNRPKVLNALSFEFLDEFTAFLSEFANFPKTWVLVIIGQGRSFAAGADIANLSKISKTQGNFVAQKGQNSFLRLQNLPHTTIAAINGLALGGGCELALSCKIRVASAQARFALPETALGLIPAGTGTQLVPRTIGLGNALFWLTTGSFFSAEDALKAGLIHKISDLEGKKFEKWVFEYAKSF